MAKQSDKLMELVEKIKETQKTANQSLDGIEPRFFAGRHMLKVSAQEQLTKLESEYLEEFRKTAVLVTTHGDEQSLYVEQAIKESGEAIRVDGASFYKALATRVTENMTNPKIFGSSQFLTLIQALRTECAEQKIQDFNLPQMESDAQLAGTPESLLAHVTNLIEKTNGTALQKTAVDNEIKKQLVQRMLTTKINLVFIENLTESQSKVLSTTLFPMGGLKVETESGKVDEDFVLSSFMEISEMVKQQTKQEG